ncbi:MAG: hypothetical protein Q9M19_01020 [Mariprofundaceae bacterium]|nr:hypothetical protein [Mariprofundaceae bacterium]
MMYDRHSEPVVEPTEVAFDAAWSQWDYADRDPGTVANLITLDRDVDVQTGRDPGEWTLLEPDDFPRPGIGGEWNRACDLHSIVEAVRLRFGDRAAQEQAVAFQLGEPCTGGSRTVWVRVADRRVVWEDDVEVSMLEPDDPSSGWETVELSDGIVDGSVPGECRDMNILDAARHIAIAASLADLQWDEPANWDMYDPEDFRRGDATDDEWEEALRSIADSLGCLYGRRYEAEQLEAFGLKKL